MEFIDDTFCVLDHGRAIKSCNFAVRDDIYREAARVAVNFSLRFEKASYEPKDNVNELQADAVI